MMDSGVRPVLLGMKSADFGARRRAIESGRAAMLQVLPQLRAAMIEKSRP